MSNNIKSKMLFIMSMTIFGTIGIFRRAVSLPAEVIAMSRGITGTIFLLIFIKIKRNHLSFISLKANAVPLILSGAVIGFNWIFLFEAYEYTTVATATLCYYMAPVFIIMLSPILFNEKLSMKKIFCCTAAVTGMVLVSGIITSDKNTKNLTGILFGLGAAVFYSVFVFLNKKMCKVYTLDRTVSQLAIAAIVMLLYSFISIDYSSLTFSAASVTVLLILGVVHTGIAYTLYFSSMKGMSAQSVAILSYIDPAIAIILSAVILSEKPEAYGIIGAVLIFGSTFISEISFTKKDGNRK